MKYRTIVADPPWRFGSAATKAVGTSQALVVACQSCPWETTITPDNIRNERDYTCPRCLGPADYKYEEADHKCPNCGLQWEYAQQLAERAA